MDQLVSLAKFTRKGSTIKVWAKEILAMATKTTTAIQTEEGTLTYKSE
jgi:hypothetical protein